MDWDIDMDDIAEGFAPPNVTISDSTNIRESGTAPTTTERDPESPTLVSNKVHIRGLETLTTDDIKTYVKDHYGPMNRVEWIDDESANLVFGSESSAQDALKALSAIEIADVTQLPINETIPAKAVAFKPDVNLQVRFAMISDKKAPGAAQRSRFYLFHPEFDPEERMRGDGSRNRYRDRSGDDHYRRNGRGRGRRDRESSVEVFHASMYDDEDTLADHDSRAARQRRRSHSRGSSSRGDRSYTSRNQEKELFPGRGPAGGRGQRNRSASPKRDIDGDAAMDMEAARISRPSNRERASGIKERLARDNKAKELFPTKGSSAGQTHMDRVMDGTDETTRLMQRNLSVSNEGGSTKDLFDIRGRALKQGVDTGFTIKGAAGASVKELFPDRFGSGNTEKELFADKLEGRGRRRQKAEDLFS
ncbi:uncharacterized protein LY79DRAFT_513427 [Colletotrichum navitas]|uniref:RRM domain-containing protein n=1 Tax=Colletotrichum navitas TaxID=681940 RepID=A0AAD8V5S9_9PEZI|nr:uncharacterized protein LY79DRAFT_513427 [Colletotrichum navitas]KAK1594064.1 hypothetical protein LY79DRAFT_513427 [Colletotrichum navitas]